jgi:hypothetical protein
VAQGGGPEFKTQYCKKKNTFRDQASTQVTTVKEKKTKKNFTTVSSRIK